MNGRTHNGAWWATALIVLFIVLPGCGQPVEEAGKDGRAPDQTSAGSPLPTSGSGGAAPEDPSEILAETQPDAALETAIRAASPDYTSEMVEIDGRQARYAYSRIDLDADGSDEVFVYLLGSFFCGSGGCNLLIFSADGQGYELTGDLPISRVPIIVGPQRTAGWRNVIKPESGGGMPPSWVTYVHDGVQYVEESRSSDDAEPEGVRVLAGEVTFQTGIPLPPAD